MPDALPAPGARVEIATWPPVDVREIDGWWVGRSGGFTRRANSALPPQAACEVRADGAAGAESAGATLSRVEELYAESGTRPVVRLDPRAAPGLDALLAERGYRAVAPTVVMAAPLPASSPTGAPPMGASPTDASPTDASLTGTPRTGAPAAGPPGPGAADVVDALRLVWADHPDDAWLDAWLGVKATTTTDVALARRILEGAPARYLTAHDGAGPVAVLRAAPAHGWLGLSCLAVAPRARRRGLGRHLTRAALDGAPAHVDRAFLQVEESNAAAAALYRGLGFVPVDAYHYRER